MAALVRLKALQRLQAPKLHEEVTRQLKFLTIRFLCQEGYRKPAHYLRADVDLNEDERRKFVQYYELWFEFDACLEDRRTGITCGALREMFFNLVHPSMQPSFDELDKLVYEYAQTVEGYVVDYSVVCASIIPQAVADPAEIVVVEWELFRGEKRARINALYDRVAYLIEEKRAYWGPNQQKFTIQLAWEELKALREETDRRACARLKALEKLQDAPNPKLQEEVTKQLRLLAVRYLCEQGTLKPADYLRADVDLNEHERREFIRYYELWSEFGELLLFYTSPNFDSLEMMWRGLKPSIGSTFDELDKLIYEYNHLKAKTSNGYFSNYLDEKKIMEECMQRHVQVDAEDQGDPVKILANWGRGRRGYWQKISTVFCVSDRVIFPGDNDEQIASQDSSSDLKCKWLHLLSVRRQSDAEAFTGLKDFQKLQRTSPKLQQEIAKQLKLLTIRFLCEEGQLKPSAYMYVDIDLNEDERRKFAHYYELRQEFEACLIEPGDCEEIKDRRYGVTYKALKRMFDDLVRPITESPFDELDKLVDEYAQTVEGYSADFEQHLE
jgi:hypothetical protein